MPGEREIPFLKYPELTAEIEHWRAIVEKNFGESDLELCGLRRDADGGWVGIFRKKPDA